MHECSARELERRKACSPYRVWPANLIPKWLSFATVVRKCAQKLTKRAKKRGDFLRTDLC